MRFHYYFFIVIICLATSFGCKQNTTLAQAVADNKPHLAKVDSTMGIGRLQVSLNKNIPLYCKATDTTAFDTIRFSVVKSGKEKGKFRIRTSKDSLINGMSFYAGDSDEEAEGHENSGLVYFAPHLSFTVLAKTDSGYRVVLNEKTRETAYIKNDSYHKIYLEGKPYWNMHYNSNEAGEVWFLYETWEIYLKRMMSVSINEKQAVYESIDGPQKKMKERYGIITEVKGYWAKIESGRNSSNKEMAWVQWTDGKKFLIDVVSEYYY